MRIRHIHTWTHNRIARVYIALCPGAGVVPSLLTRDVNLVDAGLHSYC